MSFESLRSLDAVCRPFDGAPPPLHGTYSKFKAKFSTTVRTLARELDQLDATHIVVELDVSERNIRADGFPRTDARIDNPAVRISFESKHGPLRYETGEFSDWRDNLRAITLSLHALRAVDRYGVSTRGEQYRGWRQIPMHASDPADLIRTREDANELLRRYDGDLMRAIRLNHPDNGGDTNEFRKVIKARDILAARR